MKKASFPQKLSETKYYKKYKFICKANENKICNQNKSGKYLKKNTVLYNIY